MIPLIAIVLLGGILSIIHFKVLTIREQRTGRLIWVARPKDGIFSLQWMHSVELEQWRETFQITKKGQIHLLASRFRAFGAGVPDNGGKEFYLDNKHEWFVMKGFDRYWPDLPIGVGCYANHRLLYNNHVYRLCDWVKDGTYIDAKSESMSLISYISFFVKKEATSWMKK